MKERPILFSAPMVRAILAGAKTQTRRHLYVVSKLTDRAVMDTRYPPDYGKGEWPNVPPGHAWTLSRWRHLQPGDRLWVREAWREWSDAAWHYAADGLVLPKQRDRELAECLAQRAPFTWESYTWRPSIHMPRWASRITLEVTGVRVERLQDISTADCWAEGLSASPDVDPVHEYRDLWEAINGPGSWDANPWVWAISFRRRLP